MIKIFKYLNKKQVIQIILSLILIVASVYLDLKIPDYMSKITMYVQSPGHTVGEIIGEGKWMLLCALASLLSTILVGYLSAIISSSFSRDLRSRLFSKVESFSQKDINEFSTASLITRSNNDITQIQMVIVIGLQIFIKAPIMAIWAITKIYNKGFEWTVATAVALFILIVFVAIIMILVMPEFRMMQPLTVNINRVLRENLREQFCMVLQDSWVFEGTIKENITFEQKDIKYSEVIDVCKKVNLDHFIRTLEDDYDTVLNDKQILSQGQLQLLTIARAMVSKTPILILDEATSSVDTRTETIVQDAMDKLAHGRTSFVIAHRLSTIKKADLILFMNYGDIIEKGKHDELLKENDFYADLYKAQFER